MIYIYVCIYDNLISNNSPSLSSFRVYNVFGNKGSNVNT